MLNKEYTQGKHVSIQSETRYQKHLKAVSCSWRIWRDQLGRILEHESSIAWCLEWIFAASRRWARERRSWRESCPAPYAGECRGWWRPEARALCLSPDPSRHRLPTTNAIHLVAKLTYLQVISIHEQYNHFDKRVQNIILTTLNTNVNLGATIDRHTFVFSSLNRGFMYSKVWLYVALAILPEYDCLTSLERWFKCVPHCERRN